MIVPVLEVNLNILWPEGEVPLRVYRYFDRAVYADDFARGEVYISTLAKCRTCEDLNRVDPDEATESYASGTISGGAQDAAIQEVARRIGVHIGRSQGGTFTIGGNDSVWKVPDAYVLCVTTAHDEELAHKFGPYCVEMSDVVRFCEELTRELLDRYLIVPAACVGPVIYGHRSFAGLDDPPGRIGFVKPPRFADDREARCLWVPEPDEFVPPHPFVLSAPAVALLSRRIA